MSTIRKMQGNRQQDQPSLAEQMLLTDEPNDAYTRYLIKVIGKTEFVQKYYTRDLNAPAARIREEKRGHSITPDDYIKG
jgi:hypothetical protein